MLTRSSYELHQSLAAYRKLSPTKFSAMALLITRSMQVCSAAPRCLNSCLSVFQLRVLHIVSIVVGSCMGPLCRAHPPHALILHPTPSPYTPSRPACAVLPGRGHAGEHDALRAAHAAVHTLHLPDQVRWCSCLVSIFKFTWTAIIDCIDIHGRRYCDVIVHRQLAAALQGRGNPVGPSAVAAIAVHCNSRKKHSKEAQERHTDLFLVEMLRLAGETRAAGIVIGVLQRGYGPPCLQT